MAKKREWTEEEIDFLVENYPKEGIKFCMQGLNRTDGSIRNMVSNLNLVKTNTIPERYRYDSFNQAVVNSKSYSDVCRRIGLSTGHGNRKTVIKYIERYHLDISHFDSGYEASIKAERKQRSFKEYLVKNSSLKNRNVWLKKKLIESGLKEAKCEGEGCNISDTWLGQEITLQLDHVNGDNTDNRLENLKMLCPNCHSITPTFCKGKKRSHYQKSDISKAQKQSRDIICPNCGEKKWKYAQRCMSCENKSRIKLEIPFSLDELEQSVNDIGYAATGKKYGVSDNTIRRWINKHKQH